MSKSIEELSEAELFCDADETIYYIQHLNVQDEFEEEYEYSEEDDEYEDNEGEEEYKEDKAHEKVFDDADKALANVEKNLYPQNTNRQNYSTKRQALEKHDKKIDLSMKDGMEDKKKGKRVKDKADRATSEQVLDDKTRMIVLKLLNNNKISAIRGCISTGKEANVYHATGPEGEEYALKIYKTSILDFKDRHKYIAGDKRYKNGYSRKPKKMVATWGEKELRNLKRMHSNGLPVPEPILVRENVLMMKFLGKDGWAFSKLKDVALNEKRVGEVYREVVTIMWKIYNDCKLIHGDLSEFNMLYHQGSIYIIDVSQSVEHDHPYALNFLRTDCTNVTNFFKKQGVPTLTENKLFDFITDISITSSNMEQCLDALAEQVLLATEPTNEEKIAEGVFKEEFIPTRLTEVIDPERDISAVKSGVLDGLNYSKLVGLKTDLSGTIQRPDMLDSNKDDANSSESDSDEEDSLKDDTEKITVDPARPKHETKEEKNDRKKAVKEAQAARRKEKKEAKLKEKQKQPKKKCNIAHKGKR